MPYATTDDGVRLYYEETGSGRLVILVHEFAGDYRSWEPQLRHFGKRYRTVAFNARGFPPSDVPTERNAYSQARAADDIKSILDHLGEERAHVVGLSMGGFATLHFGFRHADRAHSLCIGGCGYGAELDKREQFQAEADVIAHRIDLKADGSIGTMDNDLEINSATNAPALVNDVNWASLVPVLLKTLTCEELVCRTAMISSSGPPLTSPVATRIPP